VGEGGGRLSEWGSMKIEFFGFLEYDIITWYVYGTSESFRLL